MKNTLSIAASVAFALSGATTAQAQVSYNGVDVDFDTAQDYGGWSWSNFDPGYTGNLAVTWAAFMDNAETQIVNSAGAGYILGVGARAYKDGATNWGHNADFGLFHLAHDATITISMEADGSDLRPAFGLWSGWASGGSRHAAFVENGALLPMAANPLESGLGLVDSDAWAYAAVQGPNASASLTRFLTAGDYTLILGGYDGTTNGQHLAYSVTISASPVPIPAAGWLFSLGFASLGVFGRRRQG